MSSKPRGPTTSLGQAAFPSIGTPAIGAPLADPLGEWEAAAERAERWAAVASSRDGAAAPVRERPPAAIVRRREAGPG
jgi:hypothetical protein